MISVYQKVGIRLTYLTWKASHVHSGLLHTFSSSSVQGTSSVLGRASSVHYAPPLYMEGLLCARGPPLYPSRIRFRWRASLCTWASYVATFRFFSVQGASSVLGRASSVDYAFSMCMEGLPCARGPPAYVSFLLRSGASSILGRASSIYYAP